MKKTQDIAKYRKEYYQKNKEKIKEYNKMWSENNPEYYKMYMRGMRANGWSCPKVTCEKCGFITHKNNLSRHQTSKKCIAISQGFKGYSKYNVRTPHAPIASGIAVKPPEEKLEEVEQLEVAVDVPVQL